MMSENVKRCSKCGQPFIKNSSIWVLNGYKKDDKLCNGCNATNSVIERLSEGGEISLDDLKILPQTLVFDPKGNNPVEESLGVKFQKIVDEYSKTVATAG